MDHTKLAEVATAAGLRDLDVLKVAKEDLSPTEAVLDLLRRYRGAFDEKNANLFEQSMQPKPFDKMSVQEQDEFRRRHGLPGQIKHPDQPVGYDAMTPRQQAAFRRKHNIPESIKGRNQFMRMF